MRLNASLSFLYFLLILNSCSNNGSTGPEDDIKSVPVRALQGAWSLTNVSGGFAGINENVEPGLIQWAFDAETSVITVINHESVPANYTGIESGTYPFSILEQGKDSYLFIGEMEVGSILIAGGTLVIDGNQRSEGSGADFYIFSFTK